MDILTPLAKVSRTLIISDIHIPYEDTRAVDQLFRFIRIYDPQRIIIAGDLVDFYRASRFLTHPDYGVTLVEEIERAKKFLELLRRTSSKTVIEFIEGNHDFRLRKYLLSNGPEVIGIDVLELPNLLDLPKLRINWYPVRKYSTSFIDSWITIGGVHIGHFNKANQGAGMTVRNLMNRREGSFVQGHAHRAALIWRRNMAGSLHFGLENPCLYDFRQTPYASDVDWQIGWSTITEGKPELFVLDPDDYSFVIGGEVYKA